MSATLTRRAVVEFGGKTYVHHEYSNGDWWVIIRSATTITARSVNRLGRYHHFQRPSEGGRIPSEGAQARTG